MARSRSFGWLALALGLAAASVGCGGKPPQLPPPDPPTVAVVKPTVRPLSPTKEFTGRLVTKDPVKVLPQVAGRVLAREFKDGDLVEEGKTVLFRIDPVLFKADVEKGKAEVAKADADAANWKAQIERDQAESARAKRQFETAGGSRADVDKAVASVKVDKAQLDVATANKAAAVAALAKADENLKYCVITAPTTGRVGQSLVAVGALVDAYKSELVSVYPVNPVYAVWEIDELTSLWYRDQIRSGVLGDPRNPATPLAVAIKLKDEKDFTTDAKDRSRNSVADYVDPEIIRGTGTRVIRATFQNTPRTGPKGEVLPPLLSAGDSVRVRMSAGTQRPVLTVPETVVFSQQRKQYVYVVVDGKAQLREVEPGAAFGGVVEVNSRASASATSGLDESDTVIADNLLRVRPGIPVTVK